MLALGRPLLAGPTRRAYPDCCGTRSGRLLAAAADRLLFLLTDRKGEHPQCCSVDIYPLRQKSMRNPFGLRWLATLGLALVPGTALSTGPFDGSWSVVVACAQAPDGAKAYRWNFTAQVRDGSFLGQYNQPGSIPSGTLSGQIQPTGNAHLTMDGLTGDPDYNLRRVHAGTPIHYTATAQFTARSGTGTRDQARHRDLAFSKI